MSSNGDQVADTPSLEAELPQKATKKIKKLPSSPLRVLCVGISYYKSSPTTKHEPWKYHHDLGSSRCDNIQESNINGIIQGQKLERHKLKEMRSQDESVFPKCMGRNRLPCEEGSYCLYPQYGDLKSYLFKTKFYQPKHTLKRCRETLIQDMKTYKEDKYQGPWTPGTSEWKKVATQVEEAAEEDREKDEIDEMLEEVMEELARGGAAADDVQHLR